MKIRFAGLLIAMLLTACQQHATETVQTLHLPITIKKGYAPFTARLGYLSVDRPTDQIWGKVYLPLKGLPKGWSKVSTSMVGLDYHQLVYQNVLMGKVNAASYTLLQKEWKWFPDPTKLSAKPIKCYVYVVTGFDQHRHQWTAIVDTNNNLDFRDETAFVPEDFDWRDLSFPYKDEQQVSYETYRSGQIMSGQLPMVIKREGNEFLYCFPQHGVAILKQGTQRYNILITSTKPDFDGAEIIQQPPVSDTTYVDSRTLIDIGEYIVFDGKAYKNKGVDTFNNWLDLEPVDPKVTVYSLQAGYLFAPLKAVEFSTGQPVSLPDRKGRYVYVDFWGTWCRPCIAEIPKLKSLYEEIDTAKVEFVGIVCGDSPDRLKRYLLDEPIGWPQILSGKLNALNDRYQVHAYPTSVLIDPQGTVIARGLRAEALRRKLRQLHKL